LRQTAGLELKKNDWFAMFVNSRLLIGYHGQLEAATLPGVSTHPIFYQGG